MNPKNNANKKSEVKERTHNNSQENTCFDIHNAYYLCYIFFHLNSLSFIPISLQTVNIVMLHNPQIVYMIAK